MKHATFNIQLTDTPGQAEREVRLYGGYRDFAGQPVFDLDCVDAMRASVRAGKSGRFLEIKR